MPKDQKIWCGNQEFSGCCHVRCCGIRAWCSVIFVGCQVVGGGWCSVVIVGCQGPVVGALSIFECVKNS